MFPGSFAAVVGGPNVLYLDRQHCRHRWVSERLSRGNRMATTDYDAPRRSTVEDADSNVESCGCVDLGAHREAITLI